MEVNLLYLLRLTQEGQNEKVPAHDCGGQQEKVATHLDERPGALGASRLRPTWRNPPKATADRLSGRRRKPLKTNVYVVERMSPNLRCLTTS